MDIQTKIKNYYILPHLPESTHTISLHDTYTCPESVKSSFKQLTKSIQYRTTVNNQPIVISFFYINSKDKCLERFKHMIVVLLLLQPTHPMQIDMLFSPVKKSLPLSGILGPEHINTGYSSGTTIVVYREEEWLKVFIHECFHNLELDIELESDELNKEILKIFPVNSKVNIRESYCEVWARILNCYLCSEYTYNGFELDRLLFKEKNHSSHQMLKVLNYMGLTYLQIQAPHSSFKEDTNILSYLILGDILMNVPFVEWCEKNNSIFKLDKLHVVDYIELIKNNIPTRTVYHYKNGSTAMSINII